MSESTMLELAAIANVPILPAENWDANVYAHRFSKRSSFIDGAKWQRSQIAADLKFMLEALPNEHKIPDPQLRAEIDLVRSKLNEIISKIQ